MFAPINTLSWIVKEIWQGKTIFYDTSSNKEYSVEW
jgi:hypothetical protein